jgi:mono/diheme cytochrome c family protein
MWKRKAICVPLVLMLATASGGMAWGADTLVQSGRAIAEANCSRCHSIELTGESPFVEAPPFRDIARMYDTSGIEEALVEGIVVGHPAMPEFQMTGEEAAAISAFIASLGR